MILRHTREKAASGCRVIPFEKKRTRMRLGEAAAAAVCSLPKGIYTPGAVSN